MKKFLVLLLIAIIACKTAEEIEIEEELIKSAQDLYNKLKKISGAIDAIKRALKNSGKAAAKSLCCTYVPSMCSFCGTVLNML